ncbi:MAG TPA: SprT family zinc-dependent metalloprotease [Longimicrobiales bacterium]|nr:SprT family zinc-dependent metalloprotease [Longimicrobiales bacterium]
MLTPQEFLAELRRRGATRLSRVSFRRNRSTFWSITQDGRVLNVHAAYGAASPELLDAFAALAREGGIASRETLIAADVVGRWPPLAPAIRAARAPHATGVVPGSCATREQTRYLRALDRYFNATRFEGRLPDDVPVRLSNRMRSALGHMLPGEEIGNERYVAEIALNIDLMLPGNGAERVDTLLHEMAHVADYLETGNRGHGDSWRAWALRAGCKPTRLYERPVHRRRRRRDRVTRVPPLPPALRAFMD